MRARGQAQAELGSGDWFQPRRYRFQRPGEAESGVGGQDPVDGLLARVPGERVVVQEGPGIKTACCRAG